MDIQSSLAEALRWTLSEGMQEFFQEKFNGATIGADGRYIGTDDWRQVKFVIPYRAKKKLPEEADKDADKLIKREQQHNDALATLRGRVEHPFAHFKREWEGLKLFRVDEEQYDALPWIAAEVHNWNIKHPA